MMKMWRMLVIPALLALPLTVASAQPIAVWGRAAALPEPRGEHAVLASGGKLYALGGWAGGKSATPLFEEYDPAKQTWRALAPLPIALTHVGFAALNGKLYAVGGFLSDVHEAGQDVAFVYDVTADVWSALPKPGIARGSVSLVTLDGKLHAIGGRGPDKKTLNQHQVFNPATMRWSNAAPLKIARDHMMAVAAEGKIHLLGGRTDQYTDVTAYHDVYDPASDSWASATPLPTARSSAAAALINGSIVVFGGECNRAGFVTYGNTEAFNLKSGQWRVLPPAGGRHGFGAGVLGDTVYFVGGAKDCGGANFTDEILTLRFN